MIVTVKASRFLKESEGQSGNTVAQWCLGPDGTDVAQILIAPTVDSPPTPDVRLKCQ